MQLNHLEPVIKIVNISFKRNDKHALLIEYIYIAKYVKLALKVYKKRIKKGKGLLFGV